MKKQGKNDPDIAGLIVKVGEQLTLLQNKVDMLVSRSLPKPVEVKPLPKPFEPPQNSQVGNPPRQDNRFRDKVMHNAICADCKKECQVPFKPSEGRPVYCKDCFALRKSGGQLKVNTDNRPKETLPVQPNVIAKPLVSEKKKPATKKKAAEKKKPVAKKQKKKAVR